MKKMNRGQIVWATISFSGLILLLTAFQNCSPTSDFDASSEAVNSSGVQLMASANDQVSAGGEIAISSTELIHWRWRLASRLSRVTNRNYSCPDSSMNGTSELSGSDPALQTEAVATGAAGHMQGGTDDPLRAGCHREVCFIGVDGDSACVKVVLTTAEDPFFVKANGQSGEVPVRADTKVTWSWYLPGPVTSFTDELYDCREPSSALELASHPAPQTGVADIIGHDRHSGYLGSSRDSSRAGCKKRLCLFTAEGGGRCVTVQFHMDAQVGLTSFMKANGQEGIVFQPASQAVRWNFKTIGPVMKLKIQDTNCPSGATLTNQTSPNEITSGNSWIGKTSLIDSDADSLGSSVDPGRRGCHRKVCVVPQTSPQLPDAEIESCVVVVFE